MATLTELRSLSGTAASNTTRENTSQEDQPGARSISLSCQLYFRFNEGLKWTRMGDWGICGFWVYLLELLLYEISTNRDCLCFHCLIQYLVVHSVVFAKRRKKVFPQQTNAHKTPKSAPAKVQEFPSNHNNAYYMPPTMLFLITINAVFTQIVTISHYNL